MKRRTFIKLSAFGGAALQFHNLLGIDYSKVKYDMPRRLLGKTGEKISIVGLGGIMLRNNGQQFAHEIVAEAYDNGIDYYDVAPAYGNAEELLGPALETYRKNCFLACKTNKRTKEESEQELNESLKKLRTDYIDLYQFHALSELGEVETIFGRSGAIETFEKAKKEGKIRFIGFSAHDEAVALKAMDMYDFDTILYPLNCVCWHNGNFGPNVYLTAKEKNMGILALKAVAKTVIPKGKEKPYKNMWYVPFENEEKMFRAISFTLSKDLTSTVHAGDEKFFGKTIEFVRTHKDIIAPSENDIAEMTDGVEPLFRYSG